jgi:hypothetical protein
VIGDQALRFDDTLLLEFPYEAAVRIVLKAQQ